MRYALISDIHANRPALEAVLADIRDRRDTKGVYHLGDLVGYAPWPDEVCEIIARAGISGVAGNYDSTVATHYKHCGCRSENPQQEELSHRSYEWTLKHVSSDTIAFLGALPFRIDVLPLGGHMSGPRMTLLHAHPLNNLIYVDESRPDAFLGKMAEAVGARAGDAMAFGHTHKPWHRIVNGVHFVNTGSVGRPKDGDWRAGYVVADFSADEPAFEFIRVPYNVEEAASAIRRNALPEEFADVLRTGGRPPL